MKKKISHFTLVEMLTVIGIIGVLAAIVTPVVVLARQRGMVSQAQGDITALMSALKQMDADYNRILKKYGGDYKIGGVGIDASKISSDIATIDGDAYDALIAELSAPKADGLTVSVNRRKKIYLDPKKDFDPSKEYNEDELQKASLYRDPWGNPYVIYVKVNRDDELAVTSSKTIVGNFAVYSKGPNGNDDKGCNADLESCITTGTHKDHDDIASWQM